MSPVSHASGSRYVALTGGAQNSFYDWYADLPPASPQTLGDQTDVPESADWWHASYLMIWGSNVPVTRTPDAHFMVEARYAGQKVVVVSPDYAEHVKFADDWLPVTARHGRGPRARHGPRRLQGVLRRPRGAVLHALREDLHRHALPGHAARARGRLHAGPLPDRLRPRRAGRGGGVEDRGHGRGDRPAGGAQRLAGLPLVALGRGPLEPRPRRHRSAVDAARPRQRVGRGPPAALRRAAGRRAAARRPGAAPRRSPGDDRSTTSSWPSTASPGPTCPASGRRATTTRASPTRPPGRSGSPASRRRSPRAWRASSRATRRSPRGGP